MQQRTRLTRNRLVALALILPALAAPTLAHVTLDEPNGGEALHVGCEFTITWHVQIAHNIQNWDLWYSTTGSSGPWIEIAMDLPPGDPSIGSVHTYDWTVPDAVSDQVSVRVRQDNAGADYHDVSNATLSITPPQLGDTNCDGVVDLLDLDTLFGCYTGPSAGPLAPDCTPTDFDGDDDTDLNDAAALQSAFTG